MGGYHGGGWKLSSEKFDKNGGESQTVELTELLDASSLFFH